MDTIRTAPLPPLLPTQYKINEKNLKNNKKKMVVLKKSCDFYKKCLVLQRKILEFSNYCGRIIKGRSVRKNEWPFFFNFENGRKNDEFSFIFVQFLFSSVVENTYKSIFSILALLRIFFVYQLAEPQTTLKWDFFLLLFFQNVFN